MCPEKRLHQTAFDFWLILCEKPYQRSEMYPQKTFTSGSLQLLVNPLRKISPATHCNGPKKCNSRQPSAFGQSPAKRSASLRRYTPEKCLTPVRFRLPFSTDREAPQAIHCNGSKKCNSGQTSAFGQYPAKSPASLRRCVLKKRSRQMAFGFWSILFGKPLK